MFGVLGRRAEGRRQQPQVMPENKRRVQGRVLALIRFARKTLEECAAEPAPRGILLDREVGSLFLHLTVSPQPRADFIQQLCFCLRRKGCSRMNSLQQGESRWAYSPSTRAFSWRALGYVAPSTGPLITM